MRCDKICSKFITLMSMLSRPKLELVFRLSIMDRISCLPVSSITIEFIVEGGKKSLTDLFDKVLECKQLN